MTQRNQRRKKTTSKMADVVEQLPLAQVQQQQQQQQQVIVVDQQIAVGESSASAAAATAGGAGGDFARNLDGQDNDDLEPTKKRCKLDGTSKGPSSSSTVQSQDQERLEQRLGGILCCAVCLDLPRTAIYQCTNGHLMCAGCFTHLLADARLRDELATCPNCRIEISKTNSSRNLAVEKAVNELPAECQFCAKQFPRHLLDRHQTDLCGERSTTCKYHRIGCPWRGPFHERPAHEESCAHPSKSGGEVMGALCVADSKRQEETELYDKIVELLSYEKVSFNDLQLKPYRTDEFIHKLFYETSRFTAFNSQWVVKSRVNDSQRDPTQSCQRTITYQLILKSKVSGPMGVHFFMVRGPFGDMKVKPCIYYCDFSDEKNESPYYQMPLQDSSECNRLLAAKAINFRLIMFQTNK